MDDHINNWIIKGRYRVEKLIGQGAYGEVYLAYELPMDNRKVAIKRLKTEMVKETRDIERFKREPVITARFRNPHVVTVFTFEEEQVGNTTEYYSVMEYVSEGSLRELLRKKPILSIVEAIELGRDICYALQDIHAAGIFHCDLKPGNILLDKYRGRLVAKVSDFGNCYEPTNPAYSVSTHTKFPRGTRPYTAPEQFEVDPQNPEIDARVDIYSLGVILYELLTGRTPSKDDRDFFVFSQESKKLPSSRFNKGISASLEAVIFRALQKKEERFANADEMLAALEQVYQEEQTKQTQFDKLYRQALANFENQDWEAALVSFREIYSGYPSFNSKEIQDKIKACEKQLELEKNYSAALSDEMDNNWGKMVEHLRIVVNLDPNYKEGQATDKFKYASRVWDGLQQLDLVRTLIGDSKWGEAEATLLKIISRYPDLIESGKPLKETLDLLADIRQNIRFENLSREAQILWEAAEVAQDSSSGIEEWEQVIKIYEKIVAARTDDKELVNKLDHARQQKESAIFYQEGLVAETKGELSEAEAKFEQAGRINPGDKKISERLHNVREKLHCRALRTETNNYLKAEDWQNAYMKVKEIGAINLDFEDTKLLLVNLEIWLKAIDYENKKEWSKAIEKLEQVTIPPFSELASEKISTARHSLNLAALYDKGVKHQIAGYGYWKEARSIFEEILQQKPNYEDVRQRLDEVLWRIRLDRLVTWIVKYRGWALGLVMINILLLVSGVWMITLIIAPWFPSYISIPPPFTLNPTRYIHDIEILVDGTRVESGFYSTKADETHTIEIHAVDTNGQPILNDEIKCQWEFNSSVQAEEQCTITYRVSPNRINQSVDVVVEGEEPEKILSRAEDTIYFNLQSEGNIK